MKILIIEDDKKIANSLKKGLMQESFACDLEFDRKNGLGSAMVLNYDLIILDRVLPEIDGIKICQALRDQDNQTPILMLTARASTSDKVEGLQCGADDYLVKPFDFLELLARVKALLRRPKNFKVSLLNYKNLTLDQNNYEVIRENEKIRLSAKEFALLRFLILNPNQIFTKDQLINKVWNFDADILPNTVEVTIANLRKKIDKPFSNFAPLIHTVRGFGYKLGDK